MAKASPNSIRAGRAYVEIAGDSSGLDKSLLQAQRRLNAFAKVTARIGAVALGAAALFAPVGIAAVKAASDANESLSRFAQVFGKETDAAAAFAEDLAKRIGRSSLQIKDALGVFQSFFVGLGFGGSEARQLSQQLAELALDFASFNNISDDEAVSRFISALSGSGEVLDRFGINIKQAALEQELLRLGIRKTWSQVTEQEKALARLSIITRTMGAQGSVGDATRTAGSFANMLKRVQGEARDLAVAVGSALIPKLAPVVALFGRVLGVVKAVVQANPGLVVGVFAAAGALALFGGAFLLVGAAAGVLSVALSGVVAVLGVLSSPITGIIALVAALGAGVVAAGYAVLRWTGLGREAVLRFALAWQFVPERARAAMSAVVDALRAGDIVNAAQVLWAGLRVVWAAGKAQVVLITAQMGTAIVDVLAKALRVVVALAFQAAQGATAIVAGAIDAITGNSEASLAANLISASLSILQAAVNGGISDTAEGAKAALGVVAALAGSEIDDAVKGLDEAVRRAREARDQAGQVAGGGVPGGLDLSALAAAGSALSDKIETLGSFGGERAGASLGGGASLVGLARDQLRQAEKTAKSTEKTASATDRLAASLTFS